MIAYDNSMYCTIPPVIIEPVENPNEDLDWKIMMKIDEENYFANGFIDLEAERNRELIKWEELKKPVMPLKVIIMGY